jgi:hypothetical protein
VRPVIINDAMINKESSIESPQNLDTRVYKTYSIEKLDLIRERFPFTSITLSIYFNETNNDVHVKHVIDEECLLMTNGTLDMHEELEKEINELLQVGG